MDFYKFAEAYDIAFDGRDYNAECNFVEWCFNTHAQVSPKAFNNSFLELCCGPAQHAREFARRGWNSAGLDLSPEMIEYAKLKADEENLNINLMTGDMINYNVNKPVAITGNFTESITHILTNEDFIAHLKSVAKNLLPGGIYLIETAHPQFFFPDNEANFWTSSRGGTEVDILFGKPDDEYDSVAQVWNLTTRIVIREDRKQTHKSESKSRHRWYLAQELKSLIQLSGEFDGFWFYGTMDIPPHPLDSSRNCDCMIVVMRKKQD